MADVISSPRLSQSRGGSRDISSAFALSVIWTSPLSDYNRVLATNQFALTVLTYPMWTQHWPLAELRIIDRETRKIISGNGGRHPLSSTAVLYLPREKGGRGLRSIEQEYKLIKIKAAVKLYESPDPMMRAVQQFEERAADKGFSSLISDAKKFAQELKAQMTITDTKCRMCHMATESTIHVLSGCSKIAQSLYTARHDRMLRPIYHCLLEKYNFQENDNGKPWYQQSLPSAVLQNEKAKIYWNVPFQLEKAPENSANKPDIVVQDKETNAWTLFEGTVCQVVKIAERTVEKQEKYTELRAGIKKECKSSSVNQINIVLDFLAGNHEQLRKDLRTITNTDREVNFLIERCQKWILSQNVNIVKTFYEYA
ncbi:uncharacterized protein LOC116305807 [Actinia tenebrosa]|uniref:Uncharacterized protein LOC116305807 n=1 Tax=Actinia tenebrosa TaxID=6105 RepID=A0A6P8IWX4_ACTTE|nr:uncharacterized protein LOC116305807 [Actinia tenebrosa]